MHTVARAPCRCHSQENLANKLGDGGALAAQLAANATEMTALVTDPVFMEHMLKHGINGHMYCHMPRLTFEQGDKVGAAAGWLRGKGGGQRQGHARGGLGVPG